jgi:SAM-dependent methyltransferase
MTNNRFKKMARADLIQEINVLGPWVHGYFDLGNGLIIEDQDELQKKRLFSARNYFCDIIKTHYSRTNLQDKTFADIGCNAGYFLFELFKEFQFLCSDGLEPKESNLLKAKFILDYFNVSKKRVRLRKFDLLSDNKNVPKYDVVLMAGLMHHLDNHLLALSNAFKMTKELCIIEAMVLPDAVNTPSVGEALELKDDVYKKFNYGFGVVGYKYESNFLDGAAAHSGIVGIPTEKALIMMMHHVGFKNVHIYRDNLQLKNEVYDTPSYREMNSSIIIAEKSEHVANGVSPDFSMLHGEIDYEYFNTIIPLDIVSSLHDMMSKDQTEKVLSGIPNLIYQSECHYTEDYGKKASVILAEKIGKEPYYPIIKTFRHAPKHKIAYEFAKTCFHDGKYEKAREILETLITICNLDWRTVFRTYYLLARVFLHYNDLVKARQFNELSLRAYDHYAPALMLKNELS